MAALRTVLHRPAAPPTPAALVRLGAVILRTDPALALTGRRCVPTRLLDADFAFAYPNLDEALEQLLSDRS
jgi:NAD dependent epimerase/dehydratase family enzyme